MNKLCPEALPVAISALAAALYQQLDPEEVGMVAAILVHLGESLGIIAAAQNAANDGTEASASVQASEAVI